MNVFGCGRVVGGRETRHTFNRVLFLFFEHDPEYGLSFKKIIDLLKPGGLFCFTYASTGRDEHGTLRTTPREIGGVKGFGDYYKNQSMLEGGGRGKYIGQARMTCISTHASSFSSAATLRKSICGHGV